MKKNEFWAIASTKGEILVSYQGYSISPVYKLRRDAKEDCTEGEKPIKIKVVAVD